MEAKVWLKKELKGETSGSITAMFQTTIALLQARYVYLEGQGSPGMKIIEIARDDMKDWANELQLTEDDEV